MSGTFYRQLPIDEQGLVFVVAAALVEVVEAGKIRYILWWAGKQVGRWESENRNAWVIRSE